jgi:hypothetical protein
VYPSNKYMKTERYPAPEQGYGNYSDKHSDCMTTWLRGGADDKAFREKCRTIALRYKKALENELTYLRSRSQSEQTQRRIAIVQDYLAIVDRDLSLLQTHDGH